MGFGIGIETSCDETGIALIEFKDDGSLELRDNQIFSQIDAHSIYGGVVPEIASRAHLDKIHVLLVAIEKTLAAHDLTLADLDYIAVTVRPGLVGSLLVGLQVAKVMAALYDLPLIAVNHLEAHLAVRPLEGGSFELPCLGLLVSGGNTVIYDYQGIDKLEIISQTTDDAIGEAYDKVAKILGLGYPGGKLIDDLAKTYQRPAGEEPLFPKLLQKQGPEDMGFSYSGIKTAVLRYQEYMQSNNEEIDLAKVAYYFQESVLELVVRNLRKAEQITGHKTLLCGGGVTANSRLRVLLKELAAKNDLELYIPSKIVYCTDNGAMIAALGYYYFKAGLYADLESEAFSYV